MKVTIPGNKKTPEKTFKENVLYKSVEIKEDGSHDVYFVLDSETENQMVLFDIITRNKIRKTKKQHSLLTKMAREATQENLRYLLKVILDRERWWVSLGLSKKDVFSSR